MKNLFLMNKNELKDYLSCEEFDELFHHTKARHMNKSDAFLKARVLEGKSSASTFLGDEKKLFLYFRVILYQQIDCFYEWLHSEEDVIIITEPLPSNMNTKNLLICL